MRRVSLVDQKLNASDQNVYEEKSKEQPRRVRLNSCSVMSGGSGELGDDGIKCAHNRAFARSQGCGGALPEGSLSTSGTVGIAVGEFVAAEELSWTLPLQPSNSDIETKVKELVKASTFKVVKIRCMPGNPQGCDGAAESCCVRISGRLDGAGADN